MIPIRYREVLPPYWYENEVAGWHFGVMEEEIDLREKKMDELVDQFLLQRATWGLGLWEWIYFRTEQVGSLANRREAIRRKRLAKKPFKLPILRQIGSQYGKLLQVTEEFLAKEIHFEYDSSSPINVEGLFTDFEYIRPVHINRAMPVTKTSTPAITLGGKGCAFSLDFPICGLEMPQELGTSGVLAIENITVGSTTSYARIDSPITGFEIPMQGGTA
ncbi:putative phage tail protein [Paenibacillus sp. AN1007]|uniref:Phage tail protein n=1 Tax=Paenibacillus sp. AN1007 TaxID=3151385 RepID=A0AAU8NJ80_9BACL